MDGDGVHLGGRQLLGDGAHLLIYVVLAHALCSCGALAFAVGGVLALQRRRSKLVAAGTVARGARRDPALRISGKDEANGGIGLPQAMTGFRGTLATDRRQPDSAAREVGCDVDRLLVRQRRGNPAHDVPQSLAGPKVVELFIDGRGVHTAERRCDVRRTGALVAMTGATV